MTLRSRLARLETEGATADCCCVIRFYEEAEPPPPLLPDGRCPECGRPVKGVRAIVFAEAVEGMPFDVVR